MVLPYAAPAFGGADQHRIHQFRTTLTESIGLALVRRRSSRTRRAVGLRYGHGESLMTTLAMPELAAPRLRTAPVITFPFIASAGVSWFIAFSLFLLFRGFGWGGDSLISASQFVRWLNPLIWA
jgi:hypothetical protein